MTFQFNFEVDEDEDILGITETLQETSINIKETEETPCVEISCEELLSSLPPLISYSPMSIPNSSGSFLSLPRRDLYDARFQLLSQQEGEDDVNDGSKSHNTLISTRALAFVDSPSDLVRGVYEGGLKTWECSVDLASYLQSHPESRKSTQAGVQRTLEIGCGTAVPSATLLHLLLTEPSEQKAERTELWLQDYNKSVLELVTIPNLLLAWYLSTASVPYREVDTEDTKNDDVNELSSSQPGEVELTPSLREAFLRDLASRNIRLRFFAGGWSSFASLLSSTPIRRNESAFNLILSSETVYERTTMPVLVQLLKQVVPRAEGQNKPRCLVAAKVLYFGVGGGIPDFVKEVERMGGKVAKEWKQDVGVGREIMTVHW